MAHQQMSGALEQSIRMYSKFLLDLHGQTAVELEFGEAAIRNVMSQNSRDVHPGEMQVIQLLSYLAECHGKSAIASLGIDPFSMEPIVRLDGDEMSF
jgi:tRNA U34 5-carboxymethylaminomethyl modifying GTPase MnmE/TrmE